MNTFLSLLFLLTLPLAGLGEVKSITGLALVTDGDTLRIKSERIRMSGIDAPEKHQSCTSTDGERYPCGLEAKDALRGKIGASEVTCYYQERDRYRRILGTCPWRIAKTG